MTRQRERTSERDRMESSPAVGREAVVPGRSELPDPQEQHGEEAIREAGLLSNGGSSGGAFGSDVHLAIRGDEAPEEERLPLVHHGGLALIRQIEPDRVAT